MKRALVIGYGISGRGAEKLLRHLGYLVEILDQSNQAYHKDVDLAILSPGISPSHPTPKALREKNVEVIGEAELALRYLNNVCIGVSGTNGKTTLTQFLAHALKGKALGNVGESLAAYTTNPNEKEILVIELSSFQLETMTSRSLDYAAMTNITPDHLDRYPSFDAYAKVKWRIGNCLKREGVCFIPKGLEKRSNCPVEIVDANLYLQLISKRRYLNKLGHVATALAFAICQRLGISEKDFTNALKTFERPPHRLERVCEINGVTFVNDSKGTNPAATLFALSQLMGPTLLIVGGDRKGLTFETWKEGLGKKVKAVFTMGEASADLKKLLDPFYEVHKKTTLREAVFHAYQLASPGDTVLLSPGCASFDQFKNYAHRGDAFKETILQL